MAYKLWRQRLSYNECEILLLPEGFAKASELTVVEAWPLDKSITEPNLDADNSKVSAVSLMLRLLDTMTAFASAKGVLALPCPYTKKPFQSNCSDQLLDLLPKQRDCPLSNIVSSDDELVAAS